MRYLYEVTMSKLDTLAVGTFIIDRSDEPYERGEPRGWTIYHEATGTLSDGFAGVCLHRTCGPCHVQGTVREHKHNGRHGPYGLEPYLTPQRLTADEMAADR